MNDERLEKIAQWLESGAPEVAFDMSEGLAEGRYFDDIYDHRGTSRLTAIAARNDRPEPECGTVCCIAGAAYLMSKAPEGRVFPSPEVQLELMTERDCGEECETPEDYARHGDWMRVETSARDWLEPTDFHEQVMLMRLFNSAIAPEECTPAQAAEAVRRLMAGQDPWPGR